MQFLIVKKASSSSLTFGCYRPGNYFDLFLFGQYELYFQVALTQEDDDENV